jgi:hypothetical protein
VNNLRNTKANPYLPGPFTKKGVVMEAHLTGCTKKPPLGLTPRFVVDRMRSIEILEACLRYVNDFEKIPNDWIQELIGINKRVKKNNQ